MAKLSNDVGRIDLINMGELTKKFAEVTIGRNGGWYKVEVVGCNDQVATKHSIYILAINCSLCQPTPLIQSCAAALPPRRSRLESL